MLQESGSTYYSRLTLSFTECTNHTLWVKGRYWNQEVNYEDIHNMTFAKHFQTVESEVWVFFAIFFRIFLTGYFAGKETIDNQ